MSFHQIVVPIIFLQNQTNFDASRLLGHWEYSISWPNHFIGFNLEVYKADGVLLAKLTGDGHQTMDRILATVEIHGRCARFLFKQHFDEHLYDLYKPGDLLFEMIESKGVLKTKWHSFKPTDSKGAELCFKKVSP